MRGDRKSTRLNSSHLGISYAVFCLKKKKKQKNHRWDSKNNKHHGDKEVKDKFCEHRNTGEYKYNNGEHRNNVEHKYIFFKDTATTGNYTLSLHDALPI